VVVGVAGSALGVRRSSFASVAALAWSHLGAAEAWWLALKEPLLGEMVREIGEAWLLMKANVVVVCRSMQLKMSSYGHSRDVKVTACSRSNEALHVAEPRLLNNADDCPTRRLMPSHISNRPLYKTSYVQSLRLYSDTVTAFPLHETGQPIRVSPWYPSLPIIREGSNVCR